MRFHFGACALDTASRQLLRDGSPTHLTPKAFDLLLALVSRRPRVLTKAEARQRLWGATHVSDANLPNLVKEVREALADDARNPRYVRTVHGIGYAFCGDARSSDEEPGDNPAVVYRLEWEGGLIALAEGEYLLGRHPASVVPNASETVSRRHALLRIAGGQVVLEDLGSRHGTFVAGQRIEEPRPLADGDSFQLGPLLFTLRAARPSLGDTQDLYP